MSILGDHYEASSKKQSREREEEEELLVFGYSCKLYRDDKKALQEDNGDLLLPWMGDKSLMVDRYDIRNRLEDKSQFGLKSNLPVRLTKEEEKFERQLEEERYLFLGKDVLEEELLAEEERKRLSESFAPAGTYHAVGFSYKQHGKTAAVREKKEEPRVMVNQPQLIQHPPSSSVDIVEQSSDKYHIPKGLVIPDNIQTPRTWKVHQIIQRTAKFISLQGTQMEIIIKTKQQYNAHFSFLHYNDRLFTYYKYLLRALVNKEYEPEEEETPEEESGTKESETENNNADSSSDSEEEVDDAYELHPLLRGSAGSPKTNSVTISSPLLRGGASAAKKTNSVTISFPLLSATQKTSTGSTNVNSAPSLSSDLPDYLYTQPSYPGYSSTLAPWAQSTTAMDSTQSAHDQGRAGGHSTSSSIYQAPIVPPPPDLQSIIDKTAAYVAKNGPGFQKTLLEKHVGDPRFDFLSPWNTYHSYYQAMVQQGQLREYQEVGPRRNEPIPAQIPVEHIVATSPAPNPNLQKLNAGTVKFKLTPKPAKAAVVSGMTIEEEEEESETSAPSAKKPRTNQNGEDKMDGKIQEFLHTVKSILI